MDQDKPDLIRDIVGMLFAIAYLFMIFLFVSSMTSEKGIDLTSPKMLGAAIGATMFLWVCFVKIEWLKVLFNNLWKRIKEFRSQSDTNQ